MKSLSVRAAAAFAAPAASPHTASLFICPLMRLVG